MTQRRGCVFTTSDRAGVEEAIERLRQSYATSEPEEQIHRLTYFDTFDARLHAAGMLLIRPDSTDRAHLQLRSLDGQVIAAAALEPEATPAFAWDLPQGELLTAISEVINVRRLLPVVELEKSERRFWMLDSNEVPVMEIRIGSAVARDPRHHEVRGPLPDRIELIAEGGHNERIAQVVDLLRLQLAPATEPPDELHIAIESLGRSLIELPSKLRLQLQPDQPAHEAVRYILRALLEIIELNEPGIRERLDTEFLHDFRVAVRRTRSALSQIKRVFPASELQRFKADFKWLGSITGRARDADVFVLKLPQYKDRLPERTGDNLEPLHGYLESLQAAAYDDLISALDSPRYREVIDAWRSFLSAPALLHDSAPNARRPIRPVASERLDRVLNKALKMGHAIDDTTPVARLHELRIQCKKLRYLLDFFSSLYDPDEIDRLIGALKKLQDNLGELNDCKVQQDALQQFARDMARSGRTPVETYLAMGRLEESLRVQQEHERKRFAKQFHRFASKKNLRLMRHLFRNEPGDSNRLRSPDDSSGQVENEIKILVDGDHAFHAVAAQLLGANVPLPNAVCQVNRFYDTESRDLGRQRIVLRLREYDDRCFLTAKGPVRHAELPSGLMSKAEEEIEVSCHERDAIRTGAMAPLELLESRGSDSSLLRLARKAVGNQSLHVIGEFRNERRTIGPLVLSSATGPVRVQVELDCTHLPGDRIDYEIEAEVLGGEPVAAVREFRALFDRLGIPWRPARSKPDRFFEALHDTSA